MTNKLIKDARLIYALTKAYIMQKAPYIYKTVYGFIPHFMPGLAEVSQGPIGVSEGMILLMDPEFVVSLTPEQFAGPIYHEVCHQVKDHLPRIRHLIGNHPQGKEAYLANLAADFTINPWLRKNKWWLPEGAFYPDQFGMPDDWMFEEYYKELWKAENLKKIKKPGFAGGACGGCSGNFISKEVEEELDAQKGRDAADRIRLRNETIQDIQSHIKTRGVGSVPGFFDQLIPFKHKESTTPWNEELGHIVCASFEKVVTGSTDFSLRRPSKRSYTRGILRPGLIDHQPELVLIEDTSGSMGNEEIQKARNEEISILKSLGIQECWLIQADSDVATEPLRVNIYNIPELKTHGRGCTDFRPAIKACEKLDPRPDIGIYLTDGWGPAPEEPPEGMEVVWVLVPDQGGTRPANWGHLVVVSDDPDERARYGTV